MEGFSIEAAKAKGRALPEWYTDAPARHFLHDFYMTAYADLGTCRPSNGFGLLPIPWDKIIAYAEFAGLNRMNAFTFSAVIRAMDRAFIGWHEATTEKRNAIERASRLAEENGAGHG